MLKHLVVNWITFFIYLLIVELLYLGSYGLQLDIISSDFKSGLENLLKANPIRAIFLGVRIGDPTAVCLTLYIEDSYTSHIVSYPQVSFLEFCLVYVW